MVLLKRVKKTFAQHSAEFYRDKKSRRHSAVNSLNEAPLRAELQNFFKNRYYLFTKYDQGIKIDDEGWYSVTPEAMAKHIAQRVHENLGQGDLNIYDPFCGVGGNLIQFAKKCGFACGTDIDQIKVEYSIHNSGIYNVSNKISVVKRDFF